MSRKGVIDSMIDRLKWAIGLAVVVGIMVTLSVVHVGHAKTTTIPRLDPRVQQLVNQQQAAQAQMCAQYPNAPGC